MNQYKHSTSVIYILQFYLRVKIHYNSQMSEKMRKNIEQKFKYTGMSVVKLSSTTQL